MKSNKRGLARILAASLYSLAGLRAGVLYEAAFRQELILFVVLLPVLSFLDVPLVYKLLLLGANSLVLIVELLNSAVESVVDMVSPEYHLLAKQAKDMGSAAVFLSLLLAAGLWLVAIFSQLGWLQLS